MGIRAEYPLALLLLIPLAAYIWWIAKATPRLAGARKIAAISVRALLLLIVVSLIAGLQPYREISQRNVVFVADRSASVNLDALIGEWIANAWENKNTEDFGGILSMGANSVIDKTLSDGGLATTDAYRFRTEPGGDYSDLSKSLQLAAAMLRDKGGGKIVLLSDGEENNGNARRSARLLADAGIGVDVLHLPSAQTRDVSVEELTVPSALGQGETFTLEVALQSTFSGEATVRLYQDNDELGVTAVRLERGSNRFVMQSIALEAGFHRFRAEVFADGDEQPLNNEAFAFSRTGGPPVVLIVEGKSGTSGNLEAALKASAIAYRMILPEQLSLELPEYAAYDSIILNNVPATRIAEKPMEWLGKANSDYGVGLIMLGGDESFGLGGYFQTPVERALPVYMDLQGKKQIPSLGLVLVIDRSGSMDNGPLELAKEAAVRTVELLRDVDTVGVIAFDSSPWWVVEPTILNDREDVIDKIMGIQPAGGTEIYTALEEGYRGLSGVEAQRKHMILLTDGQSFTSMNYNNITDAMNAELMTLSTVAIGEGADQALLQRLAQNANGRYYYTNDQSTLPAIFSRETVLMSRTYVVDGTFTPQAGEAGDWSRLWRNGVPALQAYIATTPKELAEVALWSPDGDPVLARWTHGSGRSLAWTSDSAGKWSPEWVKWGRYPDVLAEWIKWTFPQFESQPYRISTQTEGDSAKIIVESDDDLGGAEGRLSAMINDGEGEAELVELMPIAPGRYEGLLKSPPPGAYLAQIGVATETSEGEVAITGGAASGFVVPYAPEYRIGSGKGAELLSDIAAITGGRELTIDGTGEAFSGEPVTQRQPFDWSRELLLASLLLWLLDIALRRLSLPWERWLALFRISSGSVKRHSSNGARSGAGGIDQLRSRTAQKRQFMNSGPDLDGGPVATTPKATDKGEAAKGSAGAAKDGETGKQRVIVQDRKGVKHDTSGRFVEKGQPLGGDGEEKRDSGKTVNRLLAAKQKNKR